MSNVTNEEAHEAREILFKFATSNDKYDLLEGRKLNKALGNFIDNQQQTIQAKLQQISNVVKRTFPTDVVKGMKQIKSILECDKE